MTLPFGSCALLSCHLTVLLRLCQVPTTHLGRAHLPDPKVCGFCGVGSARGMSFPFLGSSGVVKAGGEPVLVAVASVGSPCDRGMHNSPFRMTFQLGLLEAPRLSSPHQTFPQRTALCAERRGRSSFDSTRVPEGTNQSLPPSQLCF